MLANEQVIDGRGWRSGAQVEKREIPMYYLRITDYADELLDNLESMTGWPERVRTMQANWIGRSEGVRFAFPHDIRDASSKLIGDGKLWVFTTRADTIMGATFCAVAAEHPLATHAAASNPQLAAFIAECKRGSVIEADVATMEKKGMATGSCRQRIRSPAHPYRVWIGNYVLMTYGDGAVMGVPGARRTRLRIREQVRPADQAGHRSRHAPGEVAAVLADTRSTSGTPTRSTASASIPASTTGSLTRRQSNAIAADLHAMGLGDKQVTYRLRDWGISRQRYWGTPIPIIHCPACGDVPVPEKDLPVRAAGRLRPRRHGQSARQARGFRQLRRARSAAAPAKRETDTMDTFVDSAWYYMRYACPGAATMVDARNEYWNPMDQYIGGIEHAILHLLYARFWTKVMRDFGLVDFDEPFTQLMTQGMLLNHNYFRRGSKGGIDYFPPSEVDVQYDADGRIAGGKLRSDGSVVEYGGIEQDVQKRAQRRGSAGPHRDLRRGHRAHVRHVRRTSGGVARCGPIRASKAPTVSSSACGRTRSIAWPRLRRLPPRSTGHLRRNRCAPFAGNSTSCSSRRTTTIAACSTTRWSRPA